MIYIFKSVWYVYSKIYEYVYLDTDSEGWCTSRSNVADASAPPPLFWNVYRNYVKMWCLIFKYVWWSSSICLRHILHIISGTGSAGWRATQSNVADAFEINLHVWKKYMYMCERCFWNACGCVNDAERKEGGHPPLNRPLPFCAHIYMYYVNIWYIY